MSNTSVEENVLVIGASEKIDRYSNKAVRLLQSKGFQPLALGRRAGEINGIVIDAERKSYTDLHTVTLYLNPKNQEDYYDYILGLAPKRVIFNPGTENSTFEQMLEEKGIETERACTLVLLNLGAF